MKLALTMFVLSAGWMAAQDHMAETLRKAVLEEDSQHNLAAAVQDYQAIVAQSDEIRKTAATALFRLAECYRKQNQNQQAIAAYSRVVRDFSDQGPLVEQSKLVLATSFSRFPPKPYVPPVADREAARLRYRSLLLQEIDAVKEEVKHAEDQVALGAISRESTVAVREKRLRLERELAAFDMGIMPAGTSAGRQ